MMFYGNSGQDLISTKTQLLWLGYHGDRACQTSPAEDGKGKVDLDAQLGTSVTSLRPN
jgi:hypothetical protein